MRRLLLALWAGVLVSVGGLLAPTLFAVLPDRALAGRVAAELFHRTTLLSIALGFALLVLSAADPSRPPRLRRLGALLPALLLAASEFLVRPQMEAARLEGGAAGSAFLGWHAVAGSLFVLAAGAALVLLVAELRARD